MADPFPTALFRQNPQNMILMDYVVQPSMPITAQLKQTQINLRGLESTVALGHEPAAVTDAVAMTNDLL